MEQVIIFVYDTGYCQTEADDPQKAVLFFHPHWVSDQQRLALCGQLMGAAHFCSTMFSSPRVLTLQCGKFILKKFGRFILSVGSDQTIAEWILEERFNSLEQLFQFYHNSFDSVFNRVECDQEAFSKKLTEVLSVYVPILQCVVCAFGNVIVLRCPKKNSTAFLEALQLLEACCNFKGVLGGVVLHSSRVVATQLDPNITKLLALTNKFHLKSYAEDVRTSFNLPSGVQIVRVYLEKDSYESLQNAANFKWAVYNGLQKKILQKAGKLLKKKKDLNKIFTVQEEDNWASKTLLKPNNPFGYLKDSSRSRKSKPKVENTTLKERSKTYVSNLNLKVCSTPTVEKTLIHEELVSICSTAKVEPASNVSTDLVPDIVQDAINSKFRNRISSSGQYSYNKFFRVSIDDLMIDFSQKTYPVPLKYYSFGVAKTYREIGLSLKDEKKAKVLIKRKNVYKTIADPMNPVFRNDGIPVSKSLHNKHLDEHYKDFLVANITIDSREEFLKSKDIEYKNIKGRINLNVKNADVKTEENSTETESKEDAKENNIENLTITKNELTRANQKAFRRSLSLPLKPLTCDTAENLNQGSAVKNKILFSRTPTTPLTTKLGLLAFEEQQLDAKPLPTPGEYYLRGFLSNQNSKNVDEKTREKVASNLLIIVHQNMTIMLILDEDLEKNQDLIQSLWEVSTTSLRKVEYLKNKNFNNLSTCLTKNSTSNIHGTTNINNNIASYSFLSIDSHWGATQRSGPWGDEELKIVGSLNYDLNKFSNITEIILRNEDSVVYGYSCGGTKIFYQQGSCSGAGLPTPADLMGMITLKARKRLERDRDVVLL